jgi:hypothetical protein
MAPVPPVALHHNSSSPPLSSSSSSSSPSLHSPSLLSPPRSDFSQSGISLSKSYLETPWRDILLDILKRFVRGASIGFGFICILETFRFLRKGGAFQRAVSLLNSKGSGRVALFCGLCPSILRFLVYFFSKVSVLPRELGWLVSGAVSGLTLILVTNRRNYQSSLSLYLLIRAFELILKSVWVVCTLFHFHIFTKSIPFFFYHLLSTSFILFFHLQISIHKRIQILHSNLTLKFGDESKFTPT